MKIANIAHLHSGMQRKDGRYPFRIGSIVEFYAQPVVGKPMILSYVADNLGNPKDGYLITSVVERIVETDAVILVHTQNSTYYLEK